MTELEVVSVLVRWAAVVYAIALVRKYRELWLLGILAVVVVLSLAQLAILAQGWQLSLRGGGLLAWDIGSVIVSATLLGGVALGDRVIRELTSTRAERAAAIAQQEREDAAKQLELRARAQQQEAVANLGRRILASGSLSAILDDAVHTVARTLSVAGASFYELSVHRSSLILRAGTGRMNEMLGTALVAGPEHHIGLALQRGQRVLVEDLDASELRRPPLMPYTYARSAVAVIVPGRERPYGVLSAHASDAGRFSEEDAHFLQGVANVLAAAIEQDRSRAEIDRSRERALQAQKLEALGRLSGGIAHDFNNMLHAIVGNTELALGRVTEDPVAAHNLSQVLTAAQRARALIQQVLTFGLRNRPERAPVRVESVVDEVIVLMRGSLPDEIQIRKSIRLPDATVVADSTQLYQVLVNLCTNAGHAMRDGGGFIDIEIEGAFLANGEARALNVRDGAYVRLIVRDTGHGIRPEIRDRIFEPFFSAGRTPDAAGEGTGMGLAVVHGIVEAHGGAIRVESEPGHGASFEVLLPQSARALRAPTAMREPAPARARVLFVDDEPALVSMSEQALGALGYDVVGMTSSSEALDHFRAHPRDFDVVVMDHNMPGLRGDALAKELLQLRADLPIILYTGFADEVTPEDVRAIGVREYLHKPLAMDALAAAVGRAIAQS